MVGINKFETLKDVLNMSKLKEEEIGLELLVFVAALNKLVSQFEEHAGCTLVLLDKGEGPRLLGHVVLAVVDGASIESR